MIHAQIKLNFSICDCLQFLRPIHFLSLFNYLNSWDGAQELVLVGLGRPYRLLPRAKNCLGTALPADDWSASLLGHACAKYEVYEAHYLITIHERYTWTDRNLRPILNYIVWACQ